jgi:hypothetical protein
MNKHTTPRGSSLLGVGSFLVEKIYLYWARPVSRSIESISRSPGAERHGWGVGREAAVIGSLFVDTRFERAAGINMERNTESPRASERSW